MSSVDGIGLFRCPVRRRPRHGRQQQEVGHEFVAERDQQHHLVRGGPAGDEAVLPGRLRPAVHFEDADSAVFNFGNTLINLLKATEAHSLIDPAKLADPDAGSRIQFTIDVDDVDAMCTELA